MTHSTLPGKLGLFSNFFQAAASAGNPGTYRSWRVHCKSHRSRAAVPHDLHIRPYLRCPPVKLQTVSTRTLPNWVRFEFLPAVPPPPNRWSIPLLARSQQSRRSHAADPSRFVQHPPLSPLTRAVKLQMVTPRPVPTRTLPRLGLFRKFMPSSPNWVRSARFAFSSPCPAPAQPKPLRPVSKQQTRYIGATDTTRCAAGAS